MNYAGNPNAPLHQPFSTRFAIGGLAPAMPALSPTAVSAPPPVTMRAAIGGEAAKEDEANEDATLGQFIPIHYHYQMLDQQSRIGGFERAIAAVVKPGMKVLELGGGTGVLSFFAARAGAERVYCVERLPHVAKYAEAFIGRNGFADRVEVVNADAGDWLPPEPVDVVICEMMHTAMIREKQMNVIASFKQRYLAKFGGPLPRFIPEAGVMAVQPVTTDYDFHGYVAPVPMFIDANNAHRAVNLAMPALYTIFSYSDDYTGHFEIDECLVMEQAGVLNSLRFITKNVLAIVDEPSAATAANGGRTIDWDMQDLIVPFAKPLEVKVGDVVRIRFRYDAGDTLLALASSIDGDD